MLFRRFKLIEEGKQKRLVFQASIFGRIFPTAFMSVWLMIWSGGCLAMLVTLILDFSWFMLLFSLPFFVAWFAGATALLYCLFGKREVIIASDSIEFITSAIVTVQRRRILFKELVGLSTSRNDEGQISLILETIGRPVTVTHGANEQELETVADILRSQIPSLKHPDSELTETVSPQLEPRKKRPSECEWEWEPTFGGQTAFTNIGLFQASSLFGLLFMNLFWNGIVAVFLIAPFADFGQGNFDGGMFLCIYIFMIPFVLIGIGMMYMLLIQVLEPFRKTTWKFSDREIARTVFYFGFPRRKIWPVMLNVQMRMTDIHENRIEVEEKTDPFSDPKPKKEGNIFSVNEEEEPIDNALCGIDFAEKTNVIVTWKKLAKGDADWITTILEKEQGSYTVG